MHLSVRDYRYRTHWVVPVPHDQRLTSLAVSDSLLGWHQVVCRCALGHKDIGMQDHRHEHDYQLHHEEIRSLVSVFR